MRSPDYIEYEPPHIADEIQEVLDILNQWHFKNWRVKAIVKTKLQEAWLFAWEINNEQF